MLILYFTLSKNPPLFHLRLLKFHHAFFSSCLFSPVVFLFGFIRVIFSKNLSRKKNKVFFFVNYFLQVISPNLQYDTYFYLFIFLPMRLFLPTGSNDVFTSIYFKFLPKDRVINCPTSLII